MSSITDFYLSLQQKYTKLYGKKTIVLMEVGSFYEMYGVDNEREKITPVKEVSQILNILLTRKNKTILENSRKNPLMAGITSIALDKYLKPLVNNNYTVVRVDQVSDPPRPKREVTKIYSPGIVIDEVNTPDFNHLAVIFIDYTNVRGKTMVSVGLSVIELTTGKSTVFEAYDSKTDTAALDYAYRFIKNVCPKEVVFYLKNSNKMDIVNFFDLEDTICHVYDDYDPNFFKIDYQNNFLLKYFPQESVLGPIEQLDLERSPNCVTAFTLLLNFVHQHNPGVLRYLRPPEIYKEERHLKLNSNSLHQLQVLSSSFTEGVDNNIRSLFDVVCKTITPPGRRMLKERIINPIQDKTELEKRYSYIDWSIKDKFYLQIRNELRGVYDIERLHRKMGIQSLNPCEFTLLDTSYIYLVKVTKMMISKNNGFSKIIKSGNFLESIEKYREFYQGKFNMTDLAKYKLSEIETNIFQPGIYQEIDNLQQQRSEITNNFDLLATWLSDKIEKGSSFVRVENNDRDGYYLTTTLKRSEIIKKAVKNNQEVKLTGSNLTFDSLQFKKQNSTVKIFSEYIKKRSDQLIIIREKIKCMSKKYYLEVTDTIYQTYYNDLLFYFEPLLGEIDVIQSSAKIAVEYNYCRPKITKKSSSFFNIKEMRHPIIERLNQDTEYIPNDFEVGYNDSDGALVFSNNGSGKSSLMKSVGLAVIMAQAGLYVSARELEYCPFDYLFTRILSNDNIFKGQSSFVVEMTELRSILHRSTKNTLILGDEVTNGTEAVSGQSIMAATIIKLSRMGAKFIFATHLHKLSEMDRIKDLDNVNFFHLSVDYDSQSDQMTYNHKLVPGAGDSVYGLRVAKYIIGLSDFIDLSEEIQREIIDENNKVNTSNYNKAVFLDNCYICKKKAEHTHHIKEQNLADSNGLIGHFHKNNKHNLISLCEGCHHNVHHGSLEINGWKKTNQGLVLDYAYKNKEAVKKKFIDYSDKIMSLKNEKNMTHKKAIEILKKDGISISMSTLGKIWKKEY